MKNEKFIRVRIDDEILKRFKILCVKKNLSLPKQVTEIIRQFVVIQEDNEKRLNKGF